MSMDYAVTSLVKLRSAAVWRHATLHSHDHAQLFWFTRGQGRFAVGAVTRGYGPNTAVFVPARTMLSYELSPQAQGVVLQLPDDPALTLPRLPFHIRVTSVEAQGTFSGHIDMIERELAANAPAQDQALQAYGLLISVWITRQLAEQDGSILRERSHALVERYAAMIEDSFRSGAGVAEYASALEVTPTHLSRVCREATGRPALAILQERIMHEACRMLLDTDSSGREVAQALGFSSPAYFTRAFTKISGHPPSQFRRLPALHQVLSAPQ